MKLTLIVGSVLLLLAGLLIWTRYRMDLSSRRKHLAIVKAKQDSSRRAMSDLLSQSHRLEMSDWGPIADGGSELFHFKPDSRLHIWIQAVHEIEPPGRPVEGQFQEVRMGIDDGSWEEFALEVGSSLESKVLVLLEESLAELKNVSRDAPSAKAQSLQWLLMRVKNRATPWTPCP